MVAGWYLLVQFALQMRDALFYDGRSDCLGWQTGELCFFEFIRVSSASSPTEKGLFYDFHRGDVDDELFGFLYNSVRVSPWRYTYSY
jgi:hypothetical protein